MALNKELINFLSIHGIKCDEKSIIRSYIPLINKALKINSKYLKIKESTDILFQLTSKKEVKSTKILAKKQPVLKFNVETQNFKNYENVGYELSEKLYSLLSDKNKGNIDKVYYYRLALLYVLRLLESRKKTVNNIDDLLNTTLDLLKQENYKDSLYLKRVVTFIKENFKISSSKKNNKITVKKVIDRKKIYFRTKETNKHDKITRIDKTVYSNMTYERDRDTHKIIFNDKEFNHEKALSLKMIL